MHRTLKIKKEMSWRALLGIWKTQACDYRTSCWLLVFRCGILRTPKPLKMEDRHFNLF